MAFTEQKNAMIRKDLLDEALCRDHRDAENIGGTAHGSGGHCKGFIL